MLALDGVDDGERCISLGEWHGYTCARSICPHMRIDTCEAAFVIGVVTCVERHVSLSSLVR